MASTETKVIYHIDDEDTPYLIKIPIPSDQVTLADFKNSLNRPAYKFFFKSMDDDFGVVKEELIDDASKLPCFNGRAISWLVTVDTSSHSSDNQHTAKTHQTTNHHNNNSKDSRPNSFYSSGVGDKTSGGEEDDGGNGNDQDKHTSSSDPLISGSSNRSNTDNNLNTNNVMKHTFSYNNNNNSISNNNKFYNNNFDVASSAFTSDIESVSMIDTDDTNSRFSSVSASRSALYYKNRKKKFKHRMPPINQASSLSSITDSTMSLNIINVTLNMDSVNFLGISIVGQTNKGGDGGIYVGSIMKGGAVAQDGRIEPGDMILEVNGVSFEDMNNDEAVEALRLAAQRPGPVSLVVAKCWDPNPKGYLPSTRQEPIKPIDLSAWVAHTEAVRAIYGRLGNPPAHLGEGLGIMTSIPECPERPGSNSPTLSHILNASRSSSESSHLSTNTDPYLIIRAMVQPDSGLDIRDRTWLKITIPSAFIGSELVTWLLSHVEGLVDRKEAKKLASSFLKRGFIKHTVHKSSFSEQCYYTAVDQHALAMQQQQNNLIGTIPQQQHLTTQHHFSNENLDRIDVPFTNHFNNLPNNFNPHNNKNINPLLLQNYPNNHPSNYPNNLQQINFPNFNNSDTELRIYDTLGPPTLNPLPPSSSINYTPPIPFNFVNDAMSLDTLIIRNNNNNNNNNNSNNKIIEKNHLVNNSNLNTETIKSSSGNNCSNRSLKGTTTTTITTTETTSRKQCNNNTSTGVSSNVTTTTTLNNSSASTTSDEKAH